MVEGLSQSFLSESDKVGFIFWKMDPVINLIGGYYIGTQSTFVTATGLEELIQPLSEIPTRYDIDIRQENVFRLTVFPS